LLFSSYFNPLHALKELLVKGRSQGYDLLTKSGGR
jgi:hypothetical protein